MVLVALSLLSLKKSTAGAFVVTVRVLSRKEYVRRICVVLQSVSRVKKIQATSTKRDLFTSYWFFSKFPMSTPVFFVWDPPPGGDL